MEAFFSESSSYLAQRKIEEKRVGGYDPLITQHLLKWTSGYSTEHYKREGPV